jgi:hypothetical protein
MHEANKRMVIESVAADSLSSVITPTLELAAARRHWSAKRGAGLRFARRDIFRLLAFGERRAVVRL